MAITRFRSSKNIDLEEIRCLSTDPMPTDTNSGSTLKVQDTGKYYEFDKKNINPATGNGWWGV